MLIGYARVSTLEQNLDLQIDALQKAGCDKILSNKISGAKAHPGLDEALVVWKLDRLGRRTIKLIQLIEELQEHGIGIKNLTNAIDTTTPEGMCIYRISNSFAELERDLARERTMAGLAATGARGRLGGGPRKLMGKQAELAAAMLKELNTSFEEVCEAFPHVSRRTLYRVAQASC